MTCYFDIANFKEFSKQTVDTNNGRIAMTSMALLKENFDIKINSVPFEECDDELQILLEEFMSGVEKEIKLELDCTSDITTNQQNYRGQLLLVENSDLVSELKSKNEILCGGITEETQTISKFFLKNTKCHSEEYLGKDITAEKYLNLKDLPFTKLIIVDRYLLKNQEGISNIDYFETNILKFLKELLAVKSTRVDIIFVYQLKKTYDSVTKTHSTDGPEISKLTDAIKKLVGKKSPKPNVIFIAVPTGKQIKDEHDRHIFSDYIRIKSGGSFIFFNNEGSLISSSTTVDYYSLCDLQYAENSMNILKKVSEYGNYTLKNYSDDCYLPSTYDSSKLFDF